MERALDLLEPHIASSKYEGGVIEHLLSQPRLRHRSNWIGRLIDAHPWAPRNLAKYVLGVEAWADEPKWIEQMIEKRQGLEEIAEHVLSKPWWSHRRDLVERLIAIGIDQMKEPKLPGRHRNQGLELLNKIAEHVVSSRHLTNPRPLVEALLLAAKESPLPAEKSRSLISTVILCDLSQPYAVDMRDTIERLIAEYPNSSVLELVAELVLSRPHAKAFGDAFLDRVFNINKASANTEDKAAYITWLRIANNTLQSEIWAHREDLMIRLIDEIRVDRLKNIARYAFSRPHSLKWTKALDKFVERADSSGLLEITKWLFRQPRGAGLEGPILRTIDRLQAEDLPEFTKLIAQNPTIHRLPNVLWKLVERAKPDTVEILRTSLFEEGNARGNHAALREIREAVWTRSATDRKARAAAALAQGCVTERLRKAI